MKVTEKYEVRNTIYIDLLIDLAANGNDRSSFEHLQKQKIGISHVKISMKELQESYFNHIEEDIKAYKSLAHHLKERIVNIRDVPEVALGHFLSNLWNGNGDEWLSVYELNMSITKN